MKKGFSIIEIIIYVSILTATTVLILSTFLTISRSNLSFKQNKDIQNVVSVGLETMIKEIREASSIDTIGNTLKLNTMYNNASSTVLFYVDQARLMMSRDDILQGPLTPQEISVTNLTFYQISTDVSEAVKIEMTIQEGIKTENLYDTVVLRGSYQ
ncbi:MAG: hypothetical protein NUV47_02580 [Patescibacteria group bacterium]|nr:hypothetical protein [Patescibacteria group bacterium]